MADSFLEDIAGERPTAARFGSLSLPAGDIGALLDRQSGVIARAQALQAGMAPHDVRRLCRQRRLVAVHPGVYVDHTGPLTWVQQAWAAVLWAWPAGLWGDSALRASDGPGRIERVGSEAVHVAIDRKRSLVRRPGVVVHQIAELDRRTLWNRSPPRLRVEEAVLDVAAEAASDYRAIAAIADAVQARRTTPQRLAATLALRRRIGRRKFLERCLDDLAQGTCSVLEHGYLVRVERPHGLPTARRQARASAGGPIYRDVLYEDFGLAVELDGRLFHDTAAARDADLDRDLSAAVGGLQTHRLGWGQVFERPCRTAGRLAQLLGQRGWQSELRSCRDCPEAAVPRMRVV